MVLKTFSINYSYPCSFNKEIKSLSCFNFLIENEMKWWTSRILLGSEAVQCVKASASLAHNRTGLTPCLGAFGLPILSSWLFLVLLYSLTLYPAAAKSLDSSWQWVIYRVFIMEGSYSPNHPVDSPCLGASGLVTHFSNSSYK